MKKLKNHKTTTKAAIFAGAAALMALTPQIHAQTSVDNLLNKLEQKGILTPSEAKELKAENADDSAADFNQALNAKFPMPDWVTSYKLSGDFRGRFDDMNSDNPAIVDRIRLRYRLRVGLQINMKDNFEVGFRLASGDGGNPLSNNQTLNGNASKKPLYVDAAYGKWTAINDGTWMMAATIGKMNQPFDTSYMVFDPDYTPEGGALQMSYKFNDDQSLRFNTAALVLDELSGSSRDPFLYGGQITWDAKWTDHVGTSLGVAGYDIVNRANLSTGYDSNEGNNTTGGAPTTKYNGTTFVDNYNPIVVDASATYKMDSFPLYHGAFPVKVFGTYMVNPAATENNQGASAGIAFGKSGKKGNWDISYRYQWLEGDAWWDQIVDDDNAAAFPTSSTAAALRGGTNIKGHLVKLNYSILDSLTFTFTCYLNDLINNPVPASKTDALHVMADLMWKF